MIYVKSSKDMGGYDSNGNRYIIIDIEADTESDLPAVNYFIDANCIIGMGSTAHTIDTNAIYQMKSSGSWELQQNGTAAYTKAETDTLITNAIAQIIPKVYGLGEQIPNNSDFDTYTTAGVYYVGSNSAAATMSNIPAANGGRLEVKYSISTSYFFQEYTTNATPVQKFIRRKISGGFTPWQSVTYT